MRQRHLYSLLDQSYTTIKVVFSQDQMNPARPPRQRNSLDDAIAGEPRPWGMPEQNYVGQAYTYKVPKDLEIKADDFVVVYTDKRGLVIAGVVEVHATPQIDIDAPFDYKWIVQRVDRESYQQRVDAERLFADSMLDIERVRQREAMVRGFQDNLPEGSEARKLFDQTVQSLSGPVVEHPAPSPSTPQASRPYVKTEYPDDEMPGMPSKA